MLNDLQTEYFTDHLSYYELNTVPPLPFLFHGCTDDAPESILRVGLRYRKNEPCLTYNLCTALLKYANPVRCSRNFHSGKSAALSKHFESAEQAAAYYDCRKDGGAVFIFSADALSVCSSSNGYIRREGGSVIGGITKWQYCHIAPGDGSGVIPSDRIGGMLRPSRELADVIKRADPLDSRRYDGGELSERLLPVLKQEQNLWFSLSPDEAAQGLARCIETAGLLDLLRKIGLTLMAAGGSIIKNDYPKMPEVMPIPFTDEEVAAAIETLCGITYQNSEPEGIRKHFLCMINGKDAANGAATP